MSKIIAAACLFAIAQVAAAETYDECLKRVLDAQVKCEVPCAKSEEACSKCNEGVRRMQQRCEDQTRKGETGKRED